MRLTIQYNLDFKDYIKILDTDIEMVIEVKIISISCVALIESSFH